MEAFQEHLPNSTQTTPPGPFLLGVSKKLFVFWRNKDEGMAAGHRDASSYLKQFAPLVDGEEEE